MAGAEAPLPGGAVASQHRGMPLFEFRCRQCDARFEQLVRGGAAVECPECRGRELEKQFSVFAVNARGATREADTPCGRACDSPGGPGACHLRG